MVAPWDSFTYTHLQCLNLVEALSILNQLREGVVAAAARHALHLFTNLQGKAIGLSITPLVTNTENMLCQVPAPATAYPP